MVTTHTQRFLKSLGPGLLFAGAAIGGSHLIQSTRAGANFGFKLIGLVLLINILKYPFFEYGQRYTVVNQQNLLHGYAKLGRWVLILYLVLTLLTAFPTVAAVSFITANIASYIVGATISPLVVSMVILGSCSAILLIGKFAWLDRTIKVVLALLAVSTVTAAAVSVHHGFDQVWQTPSPSIWTLSNFSFLLALMGWMPAPIEVSVWTSLWSRQRRRQTGYQPTQHETMVDFNIGYFGSTFLAIGFVILGAMVMFGTGETFSQSGIIFTEQLISLYTSHIGVWSIPLIAIAAFTTMFSTTFTCLDAYPRAISAALSLAFPQIRNLRTVIYWYGVLLLFFVSIIISGYFMNSMKNLIDLATTIAFLTAPIFAYLNYRVIMHEKVTPRAHRPPRWLLCLGHIGLAFLMIVGLTFIIWHIVS